MADPITEKLIAEESELLRMLDELPQGAVIDRMGLEYRLGEVRCRLAQGNPPDEDEGRWYAGEEIAGGRCERLRAALQDLYDVQNGPPLERDREAWGDAMLRAKAVLRVTRDA